MTTTAQVTATPTTIAQKYNLSIEQLSAATHVVVGTQHCVIVESSSVPDQEYKVIWNDEHQCLQCTAHNGEACKASTNGKQCYHLRAALAIIELEQAQLLRQRQAEQAEIEASEEYVIDQLVLELDERLDLLRSKLNATHASDREFSKFVRANHQREGRCPHCGQ